MFDASSLRKLKLPAIVALALVILLAGSLRPSRDPRRNTYLTTSNIRLLTTIGHQFDEWVQRQEHIFRIVIGFRRSRHDDKGVEVGPNVEVRGTTAPKRCLCAGTQSRPRWWWTRAASCRWS